MAKISLTKINSTAKSEIILHKKLFSIMLTIIIFASVFVAVGVQPSNIEGYSATANAIMLFGVILYAVVILAGLVLVTSLFRELNSKQFADMSFSLPLTAKERYFSKVLAIIYVQIIPTIVTSLVTWVIPLIRYGADAAVFTDLGKIILCVISLIMFVDAVTIFVTVCCGTLAESIYISIILIAALNVVPTLFFKKIVLVFAGVYSSLSADFLNYWTLSAFFGYVNTNISACILPCVVSVILSLVLIYASVLFYKKRDGKSTGKPIVFKAFFELFAFVFVFSVLVIFSFTSSAVAGIILSLLCVLIIRIVTERGKISPKNVLVWIEKYVCAFALFSVIVAIGYYSDGFGYIDTALSKNDFTSCNVSVTYYSDRDFFQWFTEENKQSTYDEASEMLDTARSLKEEKTHSFSDMMTLIWDNNNSLDIDISDRTTYLDNYLSAIDEDETDVHHSLSISITDHYSEKNFTVSFDVAAGNDEKIKACINSLDKLSSRHSRIENGDLTIIND